MREQVADIELRLVPISFSDGSRRRSRRRC